MTNLSVILPTSTFRQWLLTNQSATEQPTCIMVFFSSKILVAYFLSGNFFICVLLGAVPNREAKRDLVHEVCKVVNQIERGRINRAAQISEEVTERVNRPTNGNNEFHDVEASFDVTANFG